MNGELVKRQDRWDLYAEDGSKIGSSAPNPMNKLSIKNCEAIANGYDLDELALDYYKLVFGNTKSYKDGFQKALEILGDKKFSEEDVKFMFQLGFNLDNAISRNEYDAHIQSLQQTEWDVEIVTEPMNLDEIREQGKGFLNSNTNKPKLDGNGCLILKRK